MSLEDFDDPKIVERGLKFLKEALKNQEECVKQGHPNAKYSHGTRFGGEFLTHMNCPICGHYTRQPTKKESEVYIQSKPVTASS